MKMSQYAGSAYIKFDDVRDGPRVEKIASVDIGGFDRPEATFESGDILSLNKGNCRVLLKNYGDDSRDWVGCEIELYAGKVDYQGQSTDSVLVRPITPPKPDKVAAIPKRPAPTPRPAPDVNGGRGDMDDEIPFE